MGDKLDGYGMIIDPPPPLHISPREHRKLARNIADVKHLASELAIYVDCRGSRAYLGTVQLRELMHAIEVLQCP